MLVILSAFVIVVCINNAESVIVDFRRLCDSDEVDFGFRKTTYQHKAVHFCFATKLHGANCKDIGKGRV
jgi:hypothetical protein